MPFAEDFDTFLDVDDFADVLVFHTASSGDVEASGIFDAAFVDAQTGDMDLESNQPRAMVKFSDMAHVVRGDTVTVPTGPGRPDAVVYDVLQVQPDGTGMATVILGNR